MDTKQIENLSKALGDEMRLRVLAAINATDNLTCGDLARLPGVTLATISYHLKILRAMASTIMFASSFLLKRNELGKRENVSVH